MWSNVWDPPTSIQTDNLPTQSPTDALTVETLTSFDVDESKSGHLDSQAVIEKLKFHLVWFFWQSFLFSFIKIY